MSNELLSLAHGFFGLVLLMAFSGILVWLSSSQKSDIKKIKIAAVVMLIITLVLFITGVGAYAVYRSSGGARESILAGDKAWVHNILMELKEFTGFYVLVIMFVITCFVFHFNEQIIIDKKIKKMLIYLLIIMMIWTLLTFGLGAYITKVKAI